ncbi:MAG: hypothetical protein J7J51_00500 [Candidatus Omnitrophica bacterium]|nr:hypothetical protein [Candidatus Omnitrophota bacterium]
MKRIIPIALIILIMLAILISVKGVEGANIEAKGDWFYVNGKRFFVNAVGYSGWRPHQWPGTNKVNLELVDLDFRRIKEAGFNTVRTWAALDEEELRLAQKHNLFVIQGVWIDPKLNFSNPQLTSIALRKIKNIVEYSKKYDNIIMYLVMTEPSQEVVLSAGEDKTLEFFRKAKQIIQSIDNKPVSMDSWIPLGFLDHSFWDVITFNVFMFTPESINRTMGFENYVRWVKKNLAKDKPLFIGETGGFSVSKKKLNDLGFGGNSEEEQSKGNIDSIQKTIAAGAAGVCTVSWIDTWHYPSNPNVHNNHPWEWNGILAIKDDTDLKGTPRKVYYDLQRFNRTEVFKKLYSARQNKGCSPELFISLIQGKDSYRVDEFVKIKIKLKDKKGKPASNQKIDYGFFVPIGWREEISSGRTDEKGELVITHPPFGEAGYIIFSAGSICKEDKKRYGDLVFIRIYD